MKARREAFKRQYAGKFVLAQADPFGERNGSLETYYFTIPWDEYDRQFPEMCMAILEELLRPFQITAYIDSWNYYGKRPQEGVSAYGWTASDRNSAYYHKLITPQTKVSEGLWSTEGVLISLAEKINRPLHAVIDRQPKKNVLSQFVLYCEQTAESSFYHMAELQSAMDRRACDVWVSFGTQPDEMTIEVNSGSLHTAEIVKAVTQVCTAYEKTLLIEVDQ